MKIDLFTYLLLFPFFLFGQITFEEVIPPNDFSLKYIVQSPTGEYFAQAVDQSQFIHSSTNGIDWEQQNFPQHQMLIDVQFFDDGTPLIKGNPYAEHLIRRDGNWFTMNLVGLANIEASFVKEDSLFVYHENTFAFSIDKGTTFTTLFTIPTINESAANLFKINNLFFLHFEDGSTDNLFVFDQSGTPIFSQELENFTFSKGLINNCNELLLTGSGTYYKINENLILESFNPINILPDATATSYYNTISVVGNNYYYKNPTTIYKSTGCNFDWEILFANINLEVETSYFYWINQQEDIFLFDEYRNYFVVQLYGTNIWTTQVINTNATPSIHDLDESFAGLQTILTGNKIFNKNNSTPDWTAISDLPTDYGNVQYSPNGNLYVFRNAEFLFSDDDGNSFSEITYPQITNYPEGNRFFVIGDGIIVLASYSDVTFYSLNNGQDWINAGINLGFNSVDVKLIDNTIIILNGLNAHQINISTNEITTENLDLPPFPVIQTLSDYGIAYIFIPPLSELYKFQVGGKLEFIGTFPELFIDNYTDFFNFGNDLFGFNNENYFRLENGAIITYPCIGLPDEYGDFLVSQNDHVYVFYSNSRIFRSTEPISVPVNTKEIESLLDFNIFPNPSSSVITLSTSESDFEKISSIEIVNHLGQVVFSNNDILSRVIDIGKFSSGIYSVVLKEHGDVVGVGKFVKL